MRLQKGHLTDSFANSRLSWLILRANAASAAASEKLLVQTFLVPDATELFL